MCALLFMNLYARHRSGLDALVLQLGRPVDARRFGTLENLFDKLFALARRHGKGGLFQEELKPGAGAAIVEMCNPAVVDEEAVLGVKDGSGQLHGFVPAAKFTAHQPVVPSRSTSKRNCHGSPPSQDSGSHCLKGRQAVGA